MSSSSESMRTLGDSRKEPRASSTPARMPLVRCSHGRLTWSKRRLMNRRLLRPAQRARGARDERDQRASASPAHRPGRSPSRSPAAAGRRSRPTRPRPSSGRRLSPKSRRDIFRSGAAATWLPHREANSASSMPRATSPATSVRPGRGVELPGRSRRAVVAGSQPGPTNASPAPTWPSAVAVPPVATAAPANCSPSALSRS